ncbi:hypothetical protein FB567DRAFT_561056 [Paraphoma chrysanthemicola]|uniref:Protein kinase domain-containing protein n=1 Tax=Paraphoma chrysanthemicola TaxID=798071 RepID=A0A8K0R3I1_9PLEO|nr:hypothetical protein FB567DRAFT_561056 [Paraphoma chrysanthemicola]
MDSHQGAFDFDMNMDFSNVFATTKPVEGETSTNFFFGDEGIDTTASFVDPIMFPQTAFDMQNSLVSVAVMVPDAARHCAYALQSMDNTVGSTSVWNGQLTPQSQNAVSFPPTPMQSFDTMYQPSFSSLGKRPLPLDVHDLPQSKRHESIGAFGSAMFSPLASFDAIEMGLSDEAADMCATWFAKYGILPSDKHIDSLSQLTGESAESIRHWFGRLMKQGIASGQGDSAYRSQTAILPQVQTQQFWNEYPTDLVSMPSLPMDESTQESTTIPEVAEQAVSASPTAASLRNGKKTRCTPTDDRSLLARDSNKIYQCTRKCGKRYGRKCDWKRNEEEGYPCKSWVCSLCTSEGVDNVKPCFRKYHFAQHFRNIHPSMNCDDFEESSIVCSETEFPRQCGFCKHRFESRQERIDHIADHFKAGKCMLDWNDSSDEGHNSDDSDDGDDRPSDDGSDGGAPSYPPPPCDPRGGSNSKSYGGSGGGHSDGGSGGGSQQGGFFQFQLSRLDEGETGSQCYYAQQHIEPAEVPQQTQQRTRCASEPIHERPVEFFKSASSSSSSPDRGKLDSPKGDYSHALARDALPRLFSRRPMRVGALTATTESTSAEQGSKDAIHEKDSKRTKPFTRLLSVRKMSSIEPDNWHLNSKVAAKSFKCHSTEKLTSKQTLQTIPTSSQSFLSVRLLGSGGFSTVDEVIHRETSLHLSRKTLKNRDPAAIKELWKEVNTLQKLRHPHVIRFLGAYSKGDKMSILLSPIADTTLALWLDRFMLKKPENAVDIITKMFGCLASSVRYLHEQRPIVKHMDIKPQNILIVEGNGEFPHVVLCDFGISSSEEDVLDGRISQPLTRHYIAPEVFDGFTRKEAADIWSLGCVFAEMATVSFAQGNAQWLDLRKDFNGRTGKHYWQDVPALQDKLTALHEDATTRTEANIAKTLKSMLNAQPEERPDAASLTLIFTPAPCCLSWPNDKATYPGPLEELGRVEMLVREDGVDCSAQLCQHGKPDAACNTDLSGAKLWLDQCSQSHSACGHTVLSHASRLPTRLLDLQPDGDQGSSIRVVESASIEPGTKPVDYIALSHAWTSSDAKLTIDTLHDKLTGLPLAQISRTLAAAITTVQDLGYRYIWTDSLCVIQDDQNEKHAECANMASVFRNAALTLVLDAIDNGLEPFKVMLADTPSEFAWDTRAWALQDRLLSHRFLHLGQEQMYWECNSLKASETFPRGLPSLIWEKAHTKPEEALPGFQSDPTGKIAAASGKAAGLTEHAQTTRLEPRRIRNYHARDGHDLTNKRELLRIRELDASNSGHRGDDKTFPGYNVGCLPDPRGNTQQHGQHVACDVLAADSRDDLPTAPTADVEFVQTSPPGLMNQVKHKPDDNDENTIEAPAFTDVAQPSSVTSASARKEIEVSGQLDQHGNLSRINVSRNGNVILEDANANGNVRETVEHGMIGDEDFGRKE